MQKEDARKQSREVLHERRKQVIRMHGKGVGVMQIVGLTGLSWTAGQNTCDVCCWRHAPQAVDDCDGDQSGQDALDDHR